MVILQKPGIFRGSEIRSDGRTVADRLDGRSQMNSGQHQKFSSACRIRDPRDFARAYDSGFRAGDGYLLIFASLNGTDQTRVGLSVSRKHGGAVQRNRRKRLLREAQHQRIEALLEMSAGMQALAHHTAEHDEAVAAFVQSMAKR